MRRSSRFCAHDGQALDRGDGRPRHTAAVGAGGRCHAEAPGVSARRLWYPLLTMVTASPSTQEEGRDARIR